MSAARAEAGIPPALLTAEGFKVPAAPKGKAKF